MSATNNWHRLRKWGPDRYTVLSAVLIVLAFPPWDFHVLAWFCLVPWFIALQRAPSARRGFVQGIWFSLLMTLGGFTWVTYVLHQFGGVPWALSVVALVLFGLVCQPQFLLFGPIFMVATKRASSLIALPILLALAYVGLDWILPKLFHDTLGHAFHNGPNLRQLAEVGGAHLITFLAVLFNIALWQLWREYRRSRHFGPASALCGLCVLLAVLGWGYGNSRARYWRERLAAPETSVHAGVIQGNIGDFDKVAAETGVRGAADRIVGTMLALSDQALSLSPRPDFLVWPETSYPSTFRTPQTAEELGRDQQIERFVRDRGIPLVFGGYDHLARKDFNSLFFLHPGLHPKPIPGPAAAADATRGAIPRPATFWNPSLNPNAGPADSAVRDLDVYHKRVLLPFGEYIPGAEGISFIREMFPQVGYFGRGPGPQVLPVYARERSSPLRVSPVICYEALLPEYTIEAARKGSQMILNVTNDSWFGPLQEPHLHLALAAFRSIETRLPQLRATNTGISALILPNGEVTQKSTMGQPEIIGMSVPLVSPPRTLMVAWGDWFGLAAAIAGAFGMTLHFWRGYRRKS